MEMQRTPLSGFEHRRFGKKTEKQLVWCRGQERLRESFFVSLRKEKHFVDGVAVFPLPFGKI